MQLSANTEIKTAKGNVAVVAFFFLLNITIPTLTAAISKHSAIDTTFYNRNYCYC